MRYKYTSSTAFICDIPKVVVGHAIGNLIDDVPIGDPSTHLNYGVQVPISPHHLGFHNRSKLLRGILLLLSS